MVRPSLDVLVLGPLQVRADGAHVAIAGTKPRAILSLLGLYAGQVLAADVLVDVLWGEEPPRTSHKALQTHISALRRILGDGVVLTTGAGWQLATGDTDAARFNVAATSARTALRTGDTAGALTALDHAIALWRGPPELPHTPRGSAETSRWVEEWTSVLEDRVDALLTCGEAAELVGQLERAVAEQPLRERRWRQLMLALYRAGRQADALGTYRRLRDLLDEQLGVEPSVELRQLETAILNHDPELAGPPRVLVPPTAGSRAGPAGAAQSLPVQHTSFVGRETELANIADLWGRAPLVTIVGPGGVGKTRLAVAAADAAAARFPAGRVFVDLVPARPGFVVQSVAAALGITERPQQPLADAVYECLGRGKWLLVLDNCEHVLDAISELVDGLLTRCPEVAVLATSRERLGVRSERVLTASPLDVAGATGEPAGSEAATLFRDRARSIEPDMELDTEQVGQVCRALDGVPLAIELAAVRCASLGIDGVRAGLGDRMRLLVGARGAQERHRSLRAVLDWSHDLLDAEERTTFRRLGVFAGDFDLPAAAAVAGAGSDEAIGRAAMVDVIGRLTDKNLVVRRTGRAQSTWRLLDLVRDYALERLTASGEHDRVRERHLRWAVDTAERLEGELESGDSWRDTFDGFADDLRAALVAAETDAEGRRRLARALGHLAYGRGFMAEARQHYLAAADGAPGRTTVDALQAAAAVAYAEMRHHVAYDLLLRAAEQSARSDDEASEAAALAWAVVLGKRCPGGFPSPPTAQQLAKLLARAERAGADGSPVVVAYVAAARAWTANPTRARCDGPLGVVALEAARRADDPVLICAALDGMTTVALGKGRFKQAARLAGERLDLLVRLARHDPRAGGEIVDVFHMVTETALASGNLPGALSAARRAGDDAVGSGVPILATSRLALPLALLGDFDAARIAATRMREAWERGGQPPAGWMAPAVYANAMVLGLTGDDDGFRTWSALARRLTKKPKVQGFEPFVECRVALFTGRVDDAIATAEALPDDYMGKFDAYARAIAVESAATAGRPEAAAWLAATSGLAEENDWARACLLRAEGRLRDDRGLVEESLAQWERIDARFERACTLLLLADRAAEGHDDLAAMGCTAPT